MIQRVNKCVRRWSAGMGIGLLMLSGGCHLMSKNPDELALADLAKREALSQHLVEKGNHYVAKAHYPKAKALFMQAVDANPSNGIAHNNLGLVFFYEHDFYNAAGAFEEASQKLPDDPAPRNNLGLVMEMVARPDDAIEYYWEAHQLDPINPEYLGNLIRAKVRMNQIDDELLSQLHSLLLIERRVEWQDWARDQLGLLHNPYLDRGPPQLSGNPLKGLESQPKDDTPRSGVFSSNRPGSNGRPKNESLPSQDTLRLPSGVEELPYDSPIQVPEPIPDSVPNSRRQTPSMDSMLERLD